MHSFLSFLGALISDHPVLARRIIEADESVRAILVSAELHRLDLTKSCKLFPQYGFIPLFGYVFQVQVIAILRKLQVFWTQLFGTLIVPRTLR